MSGDTDLKSNTFTSLLVMGCTLVSRVLGFVRLIIVTTFFSQAKADIINLAFSFPNTLRKLLAEGALSSAFIPVLSKNLVETPDGTVARKIVSSIWSLQILVMIPICVFCIFFSDFVVDLLADFEDPGQIQDASNLFRWLINYLPLIGLSSVFMGVLNSHKKFVVPAITPILFSVAVITSVALLRGSLGIYTMAVGVLAGGFAQVVFQYPLFHRLGYRLHPLIDFKNPEFQKIMKQWLPILATSSIFAFTQVIATKFASGLEGGSVTAIHISLTFFQLPFGIFSASITNVLFPRMSRQVARKEYAAFVESIQYGLRFLIATLVPSAIFLACASTQLISVGFLKGQFTLENVVLAGPVLVYYAAGLLSVGCFTFFQRVFYSLHDYRTPFAVSAVLAAIDIALSLWLKETALRTGGIALANSVSFTIGTVLLVIFARRKLGFLGGRKIGSTGIKVVVASIPATGILCVANSAFGRWWEMGRSLSGFGAVSLVAVLFSAFVLFGYRIAKVEMLADILSRFGRRK